MNWTKFLFAAFYCCVLYPLFMFFFGWMISKTRFHRFGVRQMAMSGFFVRSLPDRCQLEDCSNCGNWNCPNYCK